jgi:hypothetical protein
MGWLMRKERGGYTGNIRLWLVQFSPAMPATSGVTAAAKVSDEREGVEQRRGSERASGGRDRTRPCR